MLFFFGLPSIYRHGRFFGSLGSDLIQFNSIQLMSRTLSSCLQRFYNVVRMLVRKDWSTRFVHAAVAAAAVVVVVVEIVEGGTLHSVTATVLFCFIWCFDYNQFHRIICLPCSMFGTEWYPKKHCVVVPVPFVFLLWWCVTSFFFLPSTHGRFDAISSIDKESGTEIYNPCTFLSHSTILRVLPRCHIIE